MGRILGGRGTRLEDCSGLGGGVVRNIPLIQTTYILPLDGREHGSAQGYNPRPKDYAVDKLKGVDVLLVMIPAPAVRKVDGNHNLLIGEKVGPPRLGNVQPDPRPWGRGARGSYMFRMVVLLFYPVRN